MIGMRKDFPDFCLANTPIEELLLDPRSRDDIPAILYGIQHIYKNVELRDGILTLMREELYQCAGGKPDKQSRRRIDPGNGRPGMALWQLLVLALLKQGLGCDFDRLAELASKHADVQAMLGGDGWRDPLRFTVRTVTRNVQLLSAQLLGRINQLVVREGLGLAGWQEGEQLSVRCDTYVVETNVEYPTDYRLLRDALVCTVREVALQCGVAHVAGWRQDEHWKGKIEERYQELRRDYRKKNRNTRVRGLLEVARQVGRRVETSRRRLVAAGWGNADLSKLDRLVGHAERQADQLRRRLLKGEKIEHGEKVFSIHEEHTRWVSKGKAGQPVELGVPLAIAECEQQFVLGWRCLWNEQDVEVTTELAEALKADWPEVGAVSFDKGFSSRANIEALKGVVEKAVLPKRGKLSKADKEREGQAWFREARRAHAGVESAVNNLEQRGLDRVREKGKERFEQVVARGIVAANVHRIGVLVRAGERARLQRSEAIRRGLRRHRRAA